MTASYTYHVTSDKGYKAFLVTLHDFLSQLSND